MLISFIAGAVDRSRNIAEVAQKPREATEPHITKKVAEPATGGGMAAKPDIDEKSLEKFLAVYKRVLSASVRDRAQAVVL